MLELAETVIRVTGSESEIVYEALPVDDPQVRQPDITRAREVLGWEPEIELEGGSTANAGVTRPSSALSIVALVIGSSSSHLGVARPSVFRWRRRRRRRAHCSARPLRRQRDVRAPGPAFPQLQSSTAQVLRVNLRWGGHRGAVATQRRPANATDPADPAYDWSPYDAMVKRAAEQTSRCCPRSSGRPAGRTAARNRATAPKNDTTCRTSRPPRRSATAATSRRPAAEIRCRRSVSGWPGTSRTTRSSCGRSRKIGRARRCVVAAPAIYAKICNAIYGGVHSTRHQRREGRLRRDRPARKQPGAQHPPVDLAARLPRAR